MGIVLSLWIGFTASFIFALFVYWLDRYEKEPVVLLSGVFLWGAVMAAGGAFLVNTLLGIGVFLFTGSEQLTNFTTGSLIAPFVEEGLKGVAVLAVFILLRNEFDSYLDGLIYAAIVALGFAATENSFYIYRFGFEESGFSGILALSFIRIILVGWQHPFYTAFFGLGLAFARLHRDLWVKLGAPSLGLLLGIFTHAGHNTLAGLVSGPGGLAFTTFLDWSGWLFMFGVVVWAILSEKRTIRQFLSDEISRGTITSAQYQTACSARAVSLARMNGLFSSRYLANSRFYQICSELAHKKHQLERLGEEGLADSSNTAAIHRLRDELIRLSPQL